MRTKKLEKDAATAANQRWDEMLKSGKKPLDLSWMEEKVNSVEHANWLYNLCCFLLGKRKEKLSYRELFLIIYGLNKRKIGEEEAKKYAINQILKTYKYHNNKLPKDIEEND